MLLFFSCCTVFMFKYFLLHPAMLHSAIHSIQATLFSFCKFIMFNFSYYTFHLQQIYHNLLFFHITFFHIRHIWCCTFFKFFPFILHFLTVAFYHGKVFSCCTIPCWNHFMLQFLSGGTNLLVINLIQVAISVTIF